MSAKFWLLMASLLTLLTAAVIYFLYKIYCANKISPISAFS